MNRQLVFIHGRAQENKDSIQLKADWISTFKEGLAANGLDLPIAETDIHFPYYGQTLFDLVDNAPQVAEIIIRGSEEDEVKRAFIESVLKEVQATAGISDAEVDAIVDSQVRERGALNWPWVRAILQAVDAHVPGGSSASIALATNDVYQYLNNPALRTAIDSGVLRAMDPQVETVVVSHSLGTVVAYNLLKNQGAAANWQVPLFVTVGSPLAVTAIKRALSPIGHPTCATEWYNAMDPHDIVALHPLDKAHFNVNPAIENNTSVTNQTDNRHGISGYLNDKEVAKRIYDALVA